MWKERKEKVLLLLLFRLLLRLPERETREEGKEKLEQSLKDILGRIETSILFYK